MDFLVNDQSFHGQFPDIASFRIAIVNLMAMRQLAKRFGQEVYCHRSVAAAQITPTKIMQQVIQSFNRDERQALMRWITQQGPFWEDMRDHDEDDYLECNGKIVTDTAVGEAAFCRFHKIDRRLISMNPSDWLFSPVSVFWEKDNGNRISIDVSNYWETEQFESELKILPLPFKSWPELQRIAVPRFQNLCFSEKCFSFLHGVPFSKSVGERILILLDILDRFVLCHDENGKRSAEGQKIYQNFFTGKKGDGGRGALFTDSSDDEKRTFRNEMTFEHPLQKGQSIFCPWHGKIQTPQLRIHFSWPFQSGNSLYVPYIGPKITKR